MEMNIKSPIQPINKKKVQRNNNGQKRMTAGNTNLLVSQFIQALPMLVIIGH